ncbi:MAG: class B sortase [Lachnospiraceae bacterium]|nr:class B sortase [Lachnospiraceae bacterium]
MQAKIKEPKSGKKSAVKNAFLNIMLVACLAVFLGAGWKLVSALIEYREGEANYEAILDKVITTAVVRDEESQEALPIPVIDWAALKEMNDDLVGWLYIPDTKIQYPIVQGSDNDYYLTHTFDKTKNACGAIFMDAANQSDYNSDNTVLHGHNMKNGTMFGSLRKFEKKEYWESHPFIWIIKEDTAAKYEIFSVSITEAASDVYTLEFGSEDSFNNYIAKRTKIDAIYNTGVSVTADDKLLTLSTCTSDTETGRRVVQAKLVDEKVIH